MFALPTLFSSLSFLLHYSIRSSVSRHLLHAQPCVCSCVHACGCVGVCVCLCASQYVCTQGKTAESNCTGPSADAGKPACILQTETVQTKNTQAQTNTHTHKHKYTPQVPPSEPSTWTPNNLHPFSGSCVDGIGWHGLQYGLYCFRTKASPLKAKVIL